MTNEEFGGKGISKRNGWILALPRALPSLVWFRAFDCAARHLSFTAAAEELGLTQSAVSQQVRALEQRLGVGLFVRKPRGLGLTDDGRRLLPVVNGAISALAAASEGIGAGSGDGMVTVASSVSFAQWYLAPLLPKYLADHPDHRIRVVSAIWPDDFKTSMADVEIRFGSAALVGHDAVRLKPDALVAVAAPGLAVTADTLHEHRLIEATGTTDGWARWAEATGYRQRLSASVLVDYHGLAVDFARSGAGVALTSSLLAAPSLAEGALVRVHPGHLPGTDGYFLSLRAGAAPHHRAFRDWLLIATRAGGRRP